MNNHHETNGNFFPQESLHASFSQESQTQEGDIFHKKKRWILFGSLVLVGILLIVLGNLFSENDSKEQQQLADMFSKNALIWVQQEEKYGCIDSKGQFVLPAKYDSFTPFYGDYAKVLLTTKENGVTKQEYQVIDKKGNPKFSATYDGDIKYYEASGVWVIHGSLYDANLKKLTNDDIQINAEKSGYFIWDSKDRTKAGIVTATGKISYTYTFSNGENYLGFTPSNSSMYNTLKQNYCVVNVRKNLEDERYAIVNCDTGKTVYDYTNQSISPNVNNIFKVYDKNNRYNVQSILYIQDDKIFYQTSDKNIDLFYNTISNYIQIRDNSKDYNSQYSYLDVTTGKISKTKPSSADDITVDLNEWEKFAKVKKFNCGSSYGLISGDTIKLSCEWDNIEYFGMTIYQYLSKQGKEYVLVQKGGKTYLMNLKGRKKVAEFNSDSINTDKNSSFISYLDKEAKEYVFYNLITGKSTRIDGNGNCFVNLFPNYMTAAKDGKRNYYNIDLELIYSK